MLVITNYNKVTACRQRPLRGHVPGYFRGLLPNGLRPGDTFAQGELLGRVESGEGETLQAITAPFDGVVLYQTHILGVSQGMPLLAYGKLRAEGGLSRRETEGML